MDLYSLLNVETTASSDLIKKAYRKKVMQCHPDLAGVEHAKLFRDITTAYNTLGDPELRSDYDLNFLLTSNSHKTNFQNTTDSNKEKTDEVKIYVDLNLGLEEIAFGAVKDVDVMIPHTCDDCNGTGLDGSTKVEICLDCNGEGLLAETTQTLFGDRTLTSECLGCVGKGFFPLNDCVSCEGRGHSKEKVSHRVDVPAGVEDGQKLTKIVENKKQIIFVIHVVMHPYLERVGCDLACTKTISLKEAIFGSKSFVETLDGRKAIVVQPGTQSGKIVRLKGLGVNQLGGRARGDLLVRFIVDIPSAKEIEKADRIYLRRFFDEKTTQNATDSSIINTESDIINIYSKEQHDKKISKHN